MYSEQPGIKFHKGTNFIPQHNCDRGHDKSNTSIAIVHLYTTRRNTMLLYTLVYIYILYTAHYLSSLLANKTNKLG